MKRNFNADTSFKDLLFNLVLQFVILCFLAFLFINPIADQGKIDPIVKIMITAQWHDESYADIDLWVKGPVGKTVSYQNKDGNYIVLDRDDRGLFNDTYKLNGKLVAVKRNIETMNLTDLPPGLYIVNVHNYTHDYEPKNNSFYGEEPEYPIPVKVEIYQMQPFKLLYTSNVHLEYRQEKTVLTFHIDSKGKVDKLNSELQVPLFYAQETRR